MSEAELHVLKARLRGGIRNKARRGELEVPLPIGLTYHPDGSVVLDPDQSIRSALQLLFDTFRRKRHRPPRRLSGFVARAGAFHALSGVASRQG